MNVVHQDAEKLAAYVQSLTDFQIVTTIDGQYDHMGAMAADAVLQAQNKYMATVKPRVERILIRYPDARTTSSVLEILRSTEATEFLNWQGIDRAERFRQILELFKAEAIETESDLRRWLLEAPNLEKLRSIKGIGPKTIDYFKILVGISTCAIDRHLLNFLELAGISPKDYAEAQSLINATADKLGADRACFDHSIWRYMSDRQAPKPTTEPTPELLMQLMQQILDNQREMCEDLREIKTRLARLNIAPPKPSTLLDSPA